MHAGPPDMRVPIGYALRWPEAPPPSPPVDLVGKSLEFGVPDEQAFPCLPLARQAGREGGTAPAVLNAANEVAVTAFLDGRIRFIDIPVLVEHALSQVPLGAGRFAGSRAGGRPAGSSPCCRRDGGTRVSGVNIMCSC